ncbi:MAG: hypothetical protein IJA81_09050 [Akkermansia sp.]|nr:hypothetical protein [Akkermansia sp.]
MTYSIKLTPFTAALMDGAARAAGCSVEALLAGTISGWHTPSTPRSARRAANRAAHAAGQAAAAPTPEQAAEVARQLAEYGTPAPGEPAATLLHSDPLATRAPGYDPDFTPDPENFGTL